MKLSESRHQGERSASTKCCDDQCDKVKMEAANHKRFSRGGPTQSEVKVTATQNRQVKRTHFDRLLPNLLAH
jgi:hypothetical protein